MAGGRWHPQLKDAERSSASAENQPKSRSHIGKLSHQGMDLFLHNILSPLLTYCCSAAQTELLHLEAVRVAFLISPMRHLWIPFLWRLEQLSFRQFSGRLSSDQVEQFQRSYAREWHLPWDTDSEARCRYARYDWTHSPLFHASSLLSDARINPSVDDASSRASRIT